MILRSQIWDWREPKTLLWHRRECNTLSDFNWARIISRTCFHQGIYFVIFLTWRIAQKYRIHSDHFWSKDRILFTDNIHLKKIRIKFFIQKNDMYKNGIFVPWQNLASLSSVELKSWNRLNTRIYSYNGWVTSYDVTHYDVTYHDAIRGVVIRYEYGLNDIKMQNFKFLGYKKNFKIKSWFLVQVRFSPTHLTLLDRIAMVVY